MGHNSTGDSGWGFDFEREVSVAFLVLMMSNGGVWLSDEEAIFEVWPQVNNGVETDDIRVCLRNVRTGRLRNLYVQCKYTIELSKSGDSPFGKSIIRAFRDYVKWKEEKREEDCLFAIACGPLNDKSASLVEFLDYVHVKGDYELCEEFSEGSPFVECNRWVETFSSLAKKSDVKARVTTELLVDFLRHYYVFQPDIRYRGGLEEAFMLSALKAAGAEAPSDKLATIRSFVANKAKSRSRIRKDELMSLLRLSCSPGGAGVLSEGCFERKKSKSNPSLSKSQISLLGPEVSETKCFSGFADRLSKSPSILQDWFVAESNERDKELLAELFDGNGSPGSLYQVLREMAKLVEEEKYRLEVCRVALKLFRYQRERGNFGIVFDFLSFVFAPQTAFDSADSRWRPQVMRIMFDFDDEMAWFVLLGQIVSERMPPLSFDDRHSFGATDEALLSDYQELALIKATENTKRLCDVVRRLPLVDGKFLRRVLQIAKNIADYEVVSSLLNAWSEIVEWPFFAETKVDRADAILQVVMDSLRGDDFPIIVRLFDVSREGSMELDDLRKEFLKRYLISNNSAIPALQRLTKEVRHPNDIGCILAEVMGDKFDEVLFPVALEDNDQSMRSCVRAYAWTRFRRHEGLQWTKEIGVYKWTSRKRALLYAMLPTEPSVWQEAEKDAAEAISVYWQNVKVYLPDNLDAERFSKVILALTQCGRLADSLMMWSYVKARDPNVKDDVTLEMLEGFLKASRLESGIKELFHKIQMALADIHRGLRKNVKRISEIEMFFISELGERTFERMDTSCCSRRMADDAEFFVDVVRTSKDAKKREYLTKAGAEKVLRMWDIFPGVDCDGKVDQNAFCDWFSKVRDITQEDQSLINQCDKWIGEVLWWLPEPQEGMFSLSRIWSIVNDKNGVTIRCALQKRLMDSSLLMHLFNGDRQGEPYLERYSRYAKESFDRGYGNVSLLYRRVQSYLENVPRLK